MGNRKYFGTDGIRGKVGQSPITPDFVMKLGWAAGKVFRRQGVSTILIGKDTRVSGYMFESALEAGLSAAGVNIGLLGPIPTPAIAYLTRTFKAQAGIVISASHNPFYDNGIKFFSAQGTKLPDDLEHQIEAMIDAPMEVVDSSELGKAFRIEDARGRYVEFCKSRVSDELDLSSIKMVLDCANGATYQVAPAVMAELRANLSEIHVNPDGFNINEGCGSTSPEVLRRVVLAEKADIGIAFDGDGDRLILVDDHGELVDGDEILYILARHQKLKGTMDGGVVGTKMSNLGLERALADMDIPFVRADVGDRYVMEALKENEWYMGGENSGHIVLGDMTSTGDGLISALKVLEVMFETGSSLAELRQGMTKCPQKLVNVKVSDKKGIMGSPEIAKEVEASEVRMEGRGRVLLRPSGTEPLVRVMVEGVDQSEIEREVAHLVEVVKSVTK
ncbi:phosphoglucosamine mutase [Litoribrevibacter albus]|uniref:Phosphoglucosamine mutase n=1 Tax=Litoribrevibacter albus TaxID=1473156 RepID=A0AA37S682_9GAMM|nr:phosphoglucosamine mutase [Litoribrevibacter albus]GLQ29692.1 phosphoglucosamine mutase [Litoribrevibacter albus]